MSSLFNRSSGGFKSLVNVSLTITSMKPKWLKQREFNAMVRGALDAPAQHWIEHYLPLHFKHAAFPRYGYKDRSFRWNNIKRNHPASHPDHNNPFVFTGALRDYVLANAASGRMLQSSRNRRYRSVTSKKVILRVPIDVRRPDPFGRMGKRFGINPRHAGQLGASNHQELSKLLNVLKVELMQRMQRSPLNTETKKVAF